MVVLLNVIRFSPPRVASSEDRDVLFSLSTGFPYCKPPLSMVPPKPLKSWFGVSAVYTDIDPRSIVAAVCAEDGGGALHHAPSLSTIHSRFDFQYARFYHGAAPEICRVLTRRRPLSFYSRLKAGLSPFEEPASALAFVKGCRVSCSIYNTLPPSRYYCIYYCFIKI